jgi:hypothetical protein
LRALKVLCMVSCWCMHLHVPVIPVVPLRAHSSACAHCWLGRLLRRTLSTVASIYAEGMTPVQLNLDARAPGPSLLELSPHGVGHTSSRHAGPSTCPTWQQNTTTSSNIVHLEHVQKLCSLILAMKYATRNRNGCGALQVGATK